MKTMYVITISLGLAVVSGSFAYNDLSDYSLNGHVWQMIAGILDIFVCFVFAALAFGLLFFYQENASDNFHKKERRGASFSDSEKKDCGGRFPDIKDF